MPVAPTLPETSIEIGVPRYPQNSVAAGIGKAFGALGEIAADMQKRDEALWFSQAQADFLIKSDELKDSVQATEPDPTKRVVAYQQQQTKLQQDILKSAPSRDAALQAQGHFAKLGAQDYITYKGQQVKQWDDAQLANLDQQGRRYAGLLAKETDPDKQQLLERSYEGLSLSTTMGRHPAQTLDQHTKRMLAFKSQVEELRLNNIDPDEALAQLNGAVDRGLDPNRVPILKRSFVEAANRKDTLDEKHKRDGQHAAWTVGANLADAGHLNADTVNQWELDGSVNPSQADNLRGRVGKPGMALAPGVAQDVMGDVTRNNWSGASISNARNKLNQLSAQYPKDPSITAALNMLDARTRMMSDRAHTGRARTAQENLLKFDTGPAARYRGYGAFYRQKFNQAKDALHLNILQGMNPDEALKRANDSVTTGTKPADADARDQLQQDAQ